MLVTRRLLLLASLVVVLLLVGGGLTARVGAAERHAFKHVGLFTEVLDLVLENYVEPVEARPLLSGAYEGLLGSLDANGAYLSPAELVEWKRGGQSSADPGLRVLKAGSALQIVAIDPGSAADTAGLSVGDHIRSIGDRSVRDLSLAQGWRLLQGAPGSMVALDVLHIGEDFKHETLELVRGAWRGRPFALDVQRGTAVLRLNDLGRLDMEQLTRELADVRSRSVERLLVDVRNLAERDTRLAGAIAGLFVEGPVLELRDRSGRVTESVRASGAGTAWPGSIDVLVNGGTAGAGEALAAVLEARRESVVIGEPSYGLGAEPKLFELDSGAGLLLSHARWSVPSGESWNGDGLEPDEVVHGKGTAYAEVAADQLTRALEVVERRRQTGETAPAAERKAA